MEIGARATAAEGQRVLSATVRPLSATEAPSGNTGGFRRDIRVSMGERQYFVEKQYSDIDRRSGLLSAQSTLQCTDKDSMRYDRDKEDGEVLPWTAPRLWLHCCGALGRRFCRRRFPKGSHNTSALHPGGGSSSLL